MPSLVGWRRWRRQVAVRLVHAAWRRIQQAGTITADTDPGRRFAAFGPGSLIAFPVGTVYGEQWIEIGDGTMLGEQVSVCAGMMPGHDLGPASVLRIGDRCVIGRGSHIVAHHSIDIGDDVYTGPYVYITDQNHSYADPDLPIGRQWPVNAPVRIGAGTWLGTGVIVLPGSVIGRNVVVAAGSVVRGEIADRCVVAGVPARVIKGFDPATGWTRSAAEYPRGADTALSQVLAGDSRPGAFAPADPQTEPALPDSALLEPALPEPALADSALAGPSPTGATSLADLLLTPVPSEEPIAQPLLTEHDS
jgi:acetyltransferase-like isoleucine patch superfamily enzyme